MVSKRRDDDGIDEDGLSLGLKRQKLLGDFSPVSSPPTSENTRLPGFNYGDDDYEEDYKSKQNGSRYDKDEGDDNDDDDGDEEEDANHGKRSRDVEVRKDCPYLDTVNRQVLDFDFERFCSVSLSNLNVYACLVCGKYFQGRGKKSHAYTHSLEAGHHVYINLRTEKVYCLPDGYEINDPSLDDIRYVLNQVNTE